MFLHSRGQEGSAVIKTAQNITGTQLSSISDISEEGCLQRAQKILKENNHPSHSLAKNTEVSAAVPPDYSSVLSGSVL